MNFFRLPDLATALDATSVKELIHASGPAAVRLARESQSNLITT